MDIDFNIKKISQTKLDKLELVKNGSCGHFGKVYRLNRRECIKIFYSKFDAPFMKRLNEQTMVKFKTAQMPKYLVDLDGDVRGYVTDYVKGNTLVDSLDCDFSQFLKTYSKFIKTASQEISEGKYLIRDASSTNLLLNNKATSIKLVDTDWWCRKDIMTVKELISKNFNELNAAVFNRFLFLLSYDIFDLTINDDFVDYYESVREDIENKKNVKIKKLGDILKCK